MSAKSASKYARSGPRAGPALRADDDATSTVVFTVAGLTITVGGLLAWLAFGAVMTAMNDMPVVGDTFGFVGFMTLLGVVGVLCVLAYKRWS